MYKKLISYRMSSSLVVDGNPETMYAIERDIIKMRKSFYESMNIFFTLYVFWQKTCAAGLRP